MYVHCAERGELLDRVRLWFERELKRLGALERKSRERIRGLREALRSKDGRGLSAEEIDNSVALTSQRLGCPR